MRHENKAARLTHRLFWTAICLAASVASLFAEEAPRQAWNEEGERLFNVGKLDDAVRYFQGAARAAEGKRITDQAYLQSLDGLAKSLAAGQNYAQAEHYYRRLLKLKDEQLGAEHIDTASTAFMLAGVCSKREMYDKAEPLYQRVLKTLENQQPTNDLNVAMVCNCLADAYISQGKYIDAEGPLKRSLTIYGREYGEDHENVISLSHELANVYCKQRKFDEATAIFRHTVAVLEKKYGKGHPAVAAELEAAAEVFKLKQQYADAEQNTFAATEKQFLELIAFTEKTDGEDTIKLLPLLDNFAAFYMLHDESSEHAGPRLKQLLERRLDILRKELGDDHEAVGDALISLAKHYQYYEPRDKQKAEELYLQGIKVLETRFGHDDVRVAKALLSLAGLYDEPGKLEPDKLEPLYLRALAIKEKHLGRNHSGVLKVMDRLGRLYRSTGRHEQAELVGRERLQRTEAAFGTEHPEMIDALSALAGILHDRDKYIEAEILYLRALESQDANPAIRSWLYHNLLSELSDVYSDQGKNAEAESIQLRLIEYFRSPAGRADFQTPPAGSPDFHDALIRRALARLGDIYVDQQKYRDAENAFREALSKSEVDPRKHAKTLVDLLDQLAVVTRLNGNREEALQLEDRYRQLSQELVEAEPLPADDLEKWQQEARAAELADHWIRAESLFQSTIATIRFHHTCDDPRLEGLYRKLANAVRKQGREREAAIYDQRADRVADVNKSKE